MHTTPKTAIHDISHGLPAFLALVDDAGFRQIFGISETTLKRRLREGLPCARLGRKRLYDLVSVREWILARDRNPSAGRRAA